MPQLEQLLLSLPGLLLGFTVHEFAHAWVALKQGDDTAYMLGRVSLDPRAHLDPIGSLLFPILAIGSGMPLLGWARPVPTNPRKYRNYRRGDVLVSIAGVTANLILAVAFTIVFGIVLVVARGMAQPPAALETILNMAYMGVAGNVALIFFNLLPIPPLDGSHVFYHMLPPKLGASYRQLYPYGMLILWGLVLLGGFRFLIPVIGGATNLLLAPVVMMLG